MKVFLQVFHKLEHILVVGLTVLHQDVQQRQLGIVGLGEHQLVEGADSEAYSVARTAALGGGLKFEVFGAQKRD